MGYCASVSGSPRAASSLLTPCSSNLLLNSRGVLKICDFGLTREYGVPARAMSPRVLTLWYRPPELLLGAPVYTPAVSASKKEREREKDRETRTKRDRDRQMNEERREREIQGWGCTESFVLFRATANRP
jgi:hypothetical protein